MRHIDIGGGTDRLRGLGRGDSRRRKLPRQKRIAKIVGYKITRKSLPAVRPLQAKRL